MLSIQMFRLIVDERERVIKAELRAKRLLRREAVEPDDGGRSPYRGSWRASTPRASATTR